MGRGLTQPLPYPTMDDTTARQMTEIKQEIRELRRAIQELLVRSEKESLEHSQVREHRSILFGTGSDAPGLIADVANLRRFRDGIVKVLWFIAVPLLSAIGGGIAYLIYAGEIAKHAGG